MRLKKYCSTRSAAKTVNVHHLTLHRWLQQGKVKCSFTIALDGRKLYRWSEADIEKLREYKELHAGRWPKQRA